MDYEDFNDYMDICDICVIYILIDFRKFIEYGYFEVRLKKF